jgi:hypothetical protein
MAGSSSGAARASFSLIFLLRAKSFANLSASVGRRRDERLRRTICRLDLVCGRKARECDDESGEQAKTCSDDTQGALVSHDPVPLEEKGPALPPGL